MSSHPDYRSIRLEVDVDGAVATITLDRPDRLNAFTNTMRHELIDAFDRTDADDGVRAVVVTGSGRGFCAGADLQGGDRTFDYVAAAEDGSIPRDGGGTVVLRIFDSLKPVIAAINGPAVGVGITMTLPMDIRLASVDARIGFVFNRRGLVPEAASSWFLPRLVGISQAMEWVATGRVFDAEEAHRGGLVRSLHAPDSLLDAAYTLAAEIAQNTSPVSVAMSRQLMWHMLGEPHPMAAHRADSLAMSFRGTSDDAHEGVLSFLEKRPAVFAGRVSDGLPDLFPGFEPPTYD
ncbi:MAG TPA: crotonase/enoyl-CoA hydratase family protein [Acidimicrobiales bacterium]|nr:crotonase/enoyl-CoA hydratase family protein [Acidimicrobiales bacterium]